MYVGRLKNLTIHRLQAYQNQIASNESMGNYVATNLLLLLLKNTNLLFHHKMILTTPDNFTETSFCVCVCMCIIDQVACMKTNDFYHQKKFV